MATSFAASMSAARVAARLAQPQRERAQALPPAERLAHGRLRVARLAGEGRADVAADEAERRRVANRLVRGARDEVARTVAHVPRRPTLRGPGAHARPLAHAFGAMVEEQRAAEVPRRPPAELGEEEIDAVPA